VVDNPALLGEDTFTYTVKAPNGFQSNVATVTLSPTAPENGPAPIANGDGPFSVRVNTS